MRRSFGRETGLLDPRAICRSRDVGETEQRDEQNDKKLSIQRILPERAPFDLPAPIETDLRLAAETR